jgi:hypothetical protein
LDWARALLGFGIGELGENAEAVFDTLACLLKTREDRTRIDRTVLARLTARVA